MRGFPVVSRVNGHPRHGTMAANSSSRSISALFENTATACASRDFLHVPQEACRDYAEGPITLTYGEAQARVDALAARLQAAGYGPGCRVALALDNRPAFFLYFLALAKAGAGIVPLNAAMSVPELAYVLGHADVSLAVTHQGHAARLRSALPDTIPLAVAAEEPGAFARAAGPRVAGAGEAALLYTSGTTGTPKGCILTDEYFHEIGRLYTELGGYCRFDGVGDRLATPLPVTHMNALACSFMAMLMTGGCLIQLDRFHPSTWWQTIRASRATAFHYLGVMPAMLLSAPATSEDDVSATVRFAFGAGVDPRHQAAFEARFGVPLIEAWAMTETGAGAWITANREPRHLGQRCFGKPPRGLACRIVDDRGIDVAPETAGELLVRREGPDPRRGFFAGYYKDDSATSEAWAGGWFHTGDIVRAGADGCFFFVDRAKNVVRRSGENIAAVEVESALQTHGDVLACAVCAVADDVRGEEVFAFVVLRPGVPGSRDTAIRLQTHCQRLLAYHKAPGHMAFRAELPQTASQKLARGQIKALAAGAVRSAQAFDLKHLKKRAVAGRAKGYEDVVLVAPVTVPYVRYSIRNGHWFVAQALARLIQESGLDKADIDGLSLGSFTLAPDTSIGVTQHLGVTPRWLDHIPLGGACGIVALRRALRAVQSGDAEVVACIGADTNHVDSFRQSLGSFSVFARDAVFPYGSGGPNASFAFLTSYYMRSYGATREDFGKICVAQRDNALRYPHALFKKKLSLEEYLNARLIADPIRLFDCVMPCAGAEGFLVMARRRAEAHGLPYVRVRSTCERHNAFPDDPIQMRGGWELEREHLYGAAGIEPADVDFVQTYDDYPVMSVMQLEDLGFCAKGEGAQFIRRHTLSTDGSFPINTSGGQLSVGQAGCAAGFLGLVESIRQLTGRNLAQPVADARFGIAVGFGMITYDRGLCSGAAVLSRADA
ncbi:MAG TPA: AMP-binding protein [Steroidobacteraceae bacterium]|nr:AMP-binding protein [Steroidobacteraceae bacterium]